MLRMGPDGGPTILALPALFEEANRTRAIIIGVLRRLADAGWSVALPDLPGQGESLVPLAQATLDDWRAAAQAAAARLASPIHVVAVRAGTLVDADVAADSRWYWSPLTGAEQVRELTRLRDLGDGGDYAGNVLSDALLSQLAAAEPTITPPPRVVRMETDPRPADLKLAGAAPWRASEPAADPALVANLADDIATWLAACAG
jgi:pimeloyl-ACP methyl ester carboxylesterase